MSPGISLDLLDGSLVSPGISLGLRSASLMSPGLSLDLLSDSAELQNDPGGLRSDPEAFPLTRLK